MPIIMELTNTKLRSGFFEELYKELQEDLEVIFWEYISHSHLKYERHARKEGNTDFTKGVPDCYCNEGAHRGANVLIEEREEEVRKGTMGVSAIEFMCCCQDCNEYKNTIHARHEKLLVESQAQGYKDDIYGVLNCRCDFCDSAREAEN